MVLEVLVDVERVEVLAVEAGQQQAGRVVAREVRGLFRPSERGHRPQARAEPRVEHVVVLDDVGAVALGASRGALGGDDQMVASDASVGGNPMAPPKLARDTPVVDVLEPVEKYVLP